MGAGRKKAAQNLSAGRPPTTKRPHSISRKATRALINAHHTLQKKRAQAVAAGNVDRAAAAATEISALGGLEKYQTASLQGQRNDRGGDSSKVLLDWLKLDFSRETLHSGSRLSMLEIGALSTKNACSTSGLFDMKFIDLHSQEPGIQEQDFMERQVPSNESERFDIISLSLVLNYVPTPAGRGEMLGRLRVFLRKQPSPFPNVAFPAVFIVLPRPCISNSRYLTEARFDELMSILGYSRTKMKLTRKLAYSLWKMEQSWTGMRQSFPKKEVQPGAQRNNFAITL